MGISNSFLLDEVRCGFMIPAAVKQAWAAELEVLMEIDRVCRKHDIQYFADWGTLLGTVRHGGFVPWDDDLDIVMKREDYDKFMQVARYDMEEGFFAQTYDNQDDFWMFMGKVVGKNHFCFEKEHLRRFHNFPYIACVDIFVLDYVYRDSAKEEQRRITCKYMLGVADAIVEGRLVEPQKEIDLLRIEEMAGIKLNRISDPIKMGRHIYAEVEKKFAEVPEEDADMLTRMFPWGLLGNKKYYHKSYYSESIRLPFEEITIPVPLCFNSMLKSRYGNFMYYEKRGGGHDYPFFEGQKQNLLKVLDFEMPEFKVSGEEIEKTKNKNQCADGTFKVLVGECLNEMNGMQKTLLKALEDKDHFAAGDNIQSLQQLAIELGNMIEQVKGEGHISIKYLEEYCEHLYELHKALTSENDDISVIKISDINSELNDVIRKYILDKKTAIFMPVHAAGWNLLKSLWEEMIKSEDYDVYVVPLPYYFKDYDGSAKEICCEAEMFPEEINVQKYSYFTREYLEFLHPEMIIIQNPYDEWNPTMSVADMYYSKKLKEFTDKLVYIPQFLLDEYTCDCYREYSNMKYYVTMPGVVYSDVILVQSDNMKNNYVDVLSDFAGEDTRQIWEEKILPIGLPAEDTAFETKAEKILYGISIGDFTERREEYGAKILKVLRTFAVNNIAADVFIFPEDKRFAEEKAAIEGIVTKGGEKVSLVSNCGDTSQYSCYYGDPMPIVMDFRLAGKPVMLQNIDM